MTKSSSSRRGFLKAGAALAGATVAGNVAQAQAPAITGGSESRFPSADAPGSSDGGYNILFILTDQEQYMGYLWPIPLPGHERLRRTGTFFAPSTSPLTMATCSFSSRLFQKATT